MSVPAARKKSYSPPKHRHDGTSPLPLGMDWSPPPKKWEGKNTIWPHNPQTGWTFCVMIPSWIVQPEVGASHDSFMKSVVFYRIHVGIQSPEGVSSSHGVLRRFSDFTKLHSDLKRVFPRKDVPPAPPKHPLLRINSSRLLLEERRHALEEWMQKVLSDIDLSRSAPVASFLELEAAVRSSFQDWNQVTSETSSSVNTSAQSSPHSESSRKDLALARGTSLTGATGNGVLGESILAQSDEYLNSMLDQRKENVVLVDSDGRNDSVETSRESIYEEEHVTVSGHARKNSAESIGSDVSSLRGSELSTPGITSSVWDSSIDLPSGMEARGQEGAAGSEMHFLNGTDAQIILPVDQRQKLIRFLVTMQRRIGTTKTDMEDLIARLNQETTVKEYLTTKVKDLEVELEVTKQKGKETLQQAILVERERITQMQWDMDELRRKYSEMESNLKFEQNEKTRVESEKTTASGEKEKLLQELETKQEELMSLQKHLDEVEAKSKADVKVLVKEVKFLRNSQAEMKKVLSQCLEEKTELQRVLHQEKQRSACLNLARGKLLHECKILRDRLQECSVKFLAEEQEKLTVDPSSLPNVLDLLATSDNRIRLLLAEAQLLARDDEQCTSNADVASNGKSSDGPIALSTDDATITDEEITKILTDLLIDNAQLRIHLNSVMRRAVNTAVKPVKEESEEIFSRRTVLNWLLDR